MFHLKGNQSTRISSLGKVWPNNLSKTRIEFILLIIHPLMEIQPITHPTQKRLLTNMIKRRIHNINSLMDIDSMEIQPMVIASMKNQSNWRKISSLKREFYQKDTMIYHLSTETATKKNKFLNHAQS